MLYFDYAANTPVAQEVLDVFNRVSREYVANPNSPHSLGIAARQRLDEATAHIATLLGVRPDEVIYTSGASEANNLAIKGIAQHDKNRGKHIVTTYLEHSSVSGAVVALQNAGFDVDFAEIGSDGRVDLDSLRELLRGDTILVSICTTCGETGVTQDLASISNVVRSRSKALLHTDATQAVGKVPVSFEHVDLASFSPHKFYGLNGVGVLIKKESVELEPQIHGGLSTTPYRSGTPALSLIASCEAALERSYAQMDERYEVVAGLNRKLRQALSRYPKAKINSTANSLPHILNVSILGAKAELFAQELDVRGICLSTKSACCAPGTVSRPVYAITKDKKAALSTLRISLSHLTSEDDLNALLAAFDECYNLLVK